MRVFYLLRFVQRDQPKGHVAHKVNVSPDQRIRADDDVHILARGQVLPLPLTLRLPAFHHVHAQVRRKAVDLRLPIVD